ncbi:MAG: hypothetical protein RR135_07100, partial [Oscillospiraceae bacterium]
EQETKDFARRYLVNEDIERNIEEMSFKNLLSQLDNQDVYTIYCSLNEADGSISRKKLQFSYLDASRKQIILTRSDITD